MAAMQPARRLYADPAGLFLHQAILNSCQRFAAKTALVDTSTNPVRPISYGEYRELVERVPVLRNEPSLDAIRRPGERHRHSALAQRFRHCERRGEMSDRPPGRDQAPKLSLFVHGHERC